MQSGSETPHGCKGGFRRGWREVGRCHIFCLPSGGRLCGLPTFRVLIPLDPTLHGCLPKTPRLVFRSCLVLVHVELVGRSAGCMQQCAGGLVPGSTTTAPFPLVVLVAVGACVLGRHGRARVRARRKAPRAWSTPSRAAGGASRSRPYTCMRQAVRGPVFCFVARVACVRPLGRLDGLDASTCCIWTRAKLWRAALASSPAQRRPIRACAETFAFWAV